MRKKMIILVAEVLMTMGLAGCFGNNGGNTTQVNVEPITTVATSNNPKKDLSSFNEVEFSDKYLVGFDYANYDIYGRCPVVLCKVRYDKKVEVVYEGYFFDDSDDEDVRIYDLSDEQYRNIINGIDIYKIYTLDPEEPDPDEVFDGGSTYLILYGKDDKFLMYNGGFCPMNEDYNAMRRVLFENLPEDMKEDYRIVYDKVMNPEEEQEPVTYNYGLEEVYDNPIFVSIIEGEILPQKIIYGCGGEFGFMEYETEEAEQIALYVEAIQDIEIKDRLTYPDDLSYTADANESITFVLKDGRMFTLDLDNQNKIHSTDEDGNPVVYVICENEFLMDLNQSFSEIMWEEYFKELEEIEEEEE